MLRIRSFSIAFALLATGAGCSSGDFNTAPSDDDSAIADQDSATPADTLSDSGLDAHGPDSTEASVSDTRDAASESPSACSGEPDGTDCSGTPRHICLGGACVTSTCGDKFVDPGNGEECDDGNSISGDGCEPTCKFTCHDAADCTKTGGCVTGSVCDSTHKCTTGSPAPDLTPCKLSSGSDGVCDKGTCVPPGCTPPVTCGVGACARTGKTCDPSSCTPGTPTAETCNGVDDDCNGKVDDGLPAATCGLGACARTGTSCAASSCTPGTPTTETCNGIDDDCNGKIDDGVPLATCGVGACARTGTTCFAASCTPGSPTAETCNGIDDNCNGVIDDGVTQSCYSGPAGTAGVGACHAGTQTCVVGGTGTFGACTGQVLPTPETCNDVDDDCNGVVDDGLTRPCYDGRAGTEGVGLCHGGTQTCVAGSWGASCPGEAVPVAEVCDGQDNDCNGTVDDIAPVTCYDGPPATRNVGACKDGQMACATSAPYTEYCNGETLPSSAYSTTATIDHTGASTYDYNCNGTIDKEYGSYACQGTTSSTCSIKTAGFYGGLPACDGSGTWVDTCVWVISGGAGTGCQPDTSSGATNTEECR